MEVYCNKCKHEFTPQPREEGGEQFFNCPECGEKYLIGRITSRGVELRKEIQKEHDVYALMVKKGFREQRLLRQQTKIDALLKEYQKEYTKA